MIFGEYLYLGGPLDGQWRRPPDVIGRPVPEQCPNEDGETFTFYVPTKFGQMADAGEFSIRVVVMLEQTLHTVLTSLERGPGPSEGYRKRLERALLHQTMRMHLQRIYTHPELLDFGVGWHSREVRPVRRPITDDPQA